MTNGTIQTEQRKKSIREISPIDVYKLLPKTNCQECHESNCMAFATRLVNGELVLTDCPPLYHRRVPGCPSRSRAPPCATGAGGDLRYRVHSSARLAGNMSCSAMSSRTITRQPLPLMSMT